MPKHCVLSIMDMTQEAYDQIIRYEDYAKKTRQQYWYCGVVPIRKYCKQRDILAYSSESINDCISWFREEYEQGNVYPLKFRCVRKIAAVMECIAEGKPYQWLTLSPWYVTNLPEPYHKYLEDYAEWKRKNGCKETTLRRTKPLVNVY